jgi:hypothetical protein
MRKLPMSLEDLLPMPSDPACYRNNWDYFVSEGVVDYDGFTTQGLNLPTEVLEKFYYKNAQRIIPGL